MDGLSTHTLHENLHARILCLGCRPFVVKMLILAGMDPIAHLYVCVVGAISLQAHLSNHSLFKEEQPGASDAIFRYLDISNQAQKGGKEKMTHKLPPLCHPLNTNKYILPKYIYILEATATQHQRTNNNRDVQQ